MAGRLAGLWDEVLDDVHAPGATLVDGILRRTEARAAALYVWDGRRWFLRASAGDPEGGVPRILLHSAPSAKAARHRRGGGVWSAGAWG
ncbi:MAG: hypothetical protein IRY92_09070, partial [Dactylosporangium sp.]|nr:hypothetical protein [Dactylosporangium sp.]